MKISILLLALLVTGCASQPLVVKVPVPIPCPKHNLPPLPALPIDKLNKNSVSPEVNRAYVVSVFLLKQWQKEVTNAYQNLSVS